MRRKVTLIILMLLTFFSWLYFGTVLFSGGHEAERIFTPVIVTEPSYLESINFESPTPEPLEPKPTVTAKIKQTAWIPDWAMAAGLASLKQAPNSFDSVSPVWYYLNKDGTTQSKQTLLKEMKDFTSAHNIKLIPSIADFDAVNMHQVLKDDASLDSHITYLISEIEKYNYDGLDLDYESIFIDDQPAYIELVKRMYNYLDPKGKKLTIAVMPKWSNRDVYENLHQTRLVQDWSSLIPYVHELRIMTYNLTNYSSTYPGPVAPLDWMEAVLRYASSQIKLDKVVLGLALYGYDGWSDNFVITEPYLGMNTNPDSGTGKADAVTYSRILQLRKQALSDVLDPDTGEKLMVYKEKDKKYLVYYPDAQSNALRKQLAARYGLYGVAYWRMGSEDINVYN